MKKIGLAIFSFATAMAFTGTAYAAGQYGGYGSYGVQNCQPIYGGGETCVTSNKILLNKTVKNPQTGMFVDNLSINDPRYGTNQSITFQLTVTNTGDSVISQATVTDQMPSYVTNVTGPGSVSKGGLLTFTVNNLNVNESRTYTISGTTVAANSLPSNQSVACTVNQASATVGNETSSDNSQFCIEKNATVPAATTKGGLPVMPAPKMNQTPATGAESLALLAMVPSALAGFALRRKSK